MSNLYGFFGEKVYRMSTKSKVTPKLVDPFQSQTFVRENTSDKSLTTCIKINTMDFYKEESNEVLYAKLVDFLKRSGATGIDTLYFSFKIGLDYQITNEDGAVLDAGVRYIQTDAEEVNVLLNPDPITHALPYRKAEYVNKKFAISRIAGSTYGVMDRVPKRIYFKINAITIYANLTDMGSEYYIQNLGPSAQDTTFTYGSGTINSIAAHSVVLFDTRSYGITIPVQQLNYVPNILYVSVEALINQFCAVYDDAEIWNVIETNGGQESTAPSEFDFTNSPFDPVVNRPPCHGNHPFPPSKPHHKPCPPAGNRPPMPPKPPVGGGCVTPIIPILPGNGWNPDDSTIVPDVDMNQDHGDLNMEEWCKASDYETNIVRFLVVDDSISDAEFDATTMVKYSDVYPYVTDIKVGDYVKKSVVMYY